MNRHSRLNLDGTRLTEIRDGIRYTYQCFADGGFLPTSCYDVFEYQQLFRETRELLESKYKQLERSSDYLDCMKHLDLLEEIVYKDNPEGGLN